MSKLVLATLQSGYLDVDLLNQNFQNIAAAFDNTVSRDGSLPNSLEADLDLNGRSILNADVGDGANALMTQASTLALLDARSSGLQFQHIQRFAATEAQTLFILTDFTYVPGGGALAVYRNGERLFPPIDFTETSSTSFTLAAGADLDDDIVAVASEFVATVVLPPHTHVWADIFDVPSYASRWPSWTEVTDKPTTFTPAAHTHAASDITTGRLADARRGVYVQSGAPSLGSGDAGALWFW